ncbi:unnamed protein product [Xylocopa violacea]|uniref:Uncharacterized protein n=1 Tax=Xylocopa violacea TaxID=135666 RepID=A0ABP1NUU2_XYLVO
MLSSKRIESLQKIKDRRWSTKDKLDQYRGILKLHAREKKIRSQDAVKLKKRIAWQLGSYKQDVKEYRQIVNELIRGTPKGHIRSLLQSRKDLQFKCLGHETEHIYDSINEENYGKRSQLDKLRYKKKEKMKQCFELQVENVELCNIYEQEKHVSWPENRLQQQLVSRYQKSVARQNAAKAINLTYSYMLAILKRDAIYHENLLNTLTRDRRDQCRVIFRTTVMGQLVAEQIDDIGSKYKRITKTVWNNMKERERMLTFMREQVDDLWSFAQSLIRTESETIFAKELASAKISSSNVLEKQIISLEEIFDKIKNSLLVRSYRELLSRLEDQMKQRTRLLEQFERNVVERDSLLSKKNQALSTLSNIEHILVANTEEYNADRNTLLEQIAMQKKRELQQKNLKKERGELLMDIRAALQNMITMLVCVKRGNKVPTKKPTDEFEEKPDLPIIEKMETEGLTLLSTVSRKVGALFGMSNFEFDKDREERAKDLYQTYVSNYRSKLKFDDIGFEPTGLIVEHEVIDSSVPTRAEIKLRSKQAVEAHMRLE